MEWNLDHSARVVSIGHERKEREGLKVSSPLLFSSSSSYSSFLTNDLRALNDGYIGYGTFFSSGQECSDVPYSYSVAFVPSFLRFQRSPAASMRDIDGLPSDLRNGSILDLRGPPKLPCYLKARDRNITCIFVANDSSISLEHSLVLSQNHYSPQSVDLKSFSSLSLNESFRMDENSSLGEVRIPNYLLLFYEQHASYYERALSCE